MSLGDWPDYLAVGFLKNQNMLNDNDIITGIDVDDDLGVVVVRTQRETNYEEKMKKKIQKWRKIFKNVKFQFFFFS